MAIVRAEHTADACIAAINEAEDIVISAATIAEALIVSARRGLRPEMETLLSGTGFTIVAVTPDSARRVAEAYDLWGKGVHPAALNWGDCFSYEVAKSNNCALLYVGSDFAQTDVESVLMNGDRRETFDR